MTDASSLTSKGACDLARVAVQFLIYSDDLPPNEVASRLDLEPTKTAEKGLKYGSKTGTPVKIPRHMWELSSESHVLERNLSSHVEWLLCRLTPRRAQLDALRETGGIQCALIGVVWSNGTVAHVRITSQQMAALSDLRLDIQLEFADYGDDG